MSAIFHYLNLTSNFLCGCIYFFNTFKSHTTQTYVLVPHSLTQPLSSHTNTSTFIFNTAPTHKLRWTSWTPVLVQPNTYDGTSGVKTAIRNYSKLPSVSVVPTVKRVLVLTWALKKEKIPHTKNKNKRHHFTQPSFGQDSFALGVGAKRWFVKKQSKKRVTIVASPWRTTAKPSLPF